MTDVTTEVAPIDFARKWADFLAGNGLLCEKDCCNHVYGRTVLLGARYYASLPAERRAEAGTVLEKLIDGQEQGFHPIFTWDGLLAIRHRSKNNRKRGVMALRGEELIARSRTTRGR